jgi:regulator of protease activity HflC (stomatin/prohibitin superfamily)
MTSSQQLRVERPLQSANGYVFVLLAIAMTAIGAAIVYGLMQQEIPSAWTWLVSGLATAVAIFCQMGLYMLQPNEAAILTLFGHYAGTDRSEGLRWANPFYVKRRISLRSRNMNTPTLKVNDKRGNPVEIGAALVWKVRDSAQAVFEVDDYELFVRTQAETALRHLASVYAYDDGEDLGVGELTLRSGLDAVSGALRNELQERFHGAGVEVQDAKLTHLAYAPEIAQVMLRRQQAEAIISARSKIVQGAVSMVSAALKGLAEHEIVVLDDERKAAMVSNLLVVLCSDKDTQPIVNAGTLYG